MSNITCQCGHENPYGTELCEQCGRPLSDKAKESEIVDMRYEGASRRSQTYKSSIIDRIWNFFSSVKIGVSIIAAVLIASAIGTVFPQKFYVPVTTAEEYAEYYERLYGVVGKYYYQLGFYDMYNSWWFKVLVFMLATSIIIASIDRVVPLYKSLKKQRTRRHPSFMKRQRIYGEGEVDDTALSLAKAEETLKNMRYKVKTENGAILAEKHRFSRWGPYINHVGLILFFIGVLLRGIPGFYVDETMWLREGETRNIIGAPGYVLENRGFTLENYTKEEAEEVFGAALDKAGAIAKTYKTDVTLYKTADGELPGSESLEKITDYAIVVNKPLKFNGYNVFQMDYKLDELKSMTFNLVEKSTGKTFGEFTVDLSKPDKQYDLGNGSSVDMLGYYPDYDGIKDGEPYSKSPIPNNPAFIFQMNTPKKTEGEKSFVAIRQTFEVEQNDFAVKFAAADTRNISGLTIRKDKTLYILLLGGLVFMIGVIQGMYWQHRRIWIQEDAEGHLLMAAHTNKNWFSLRKELDKLRETTALPAYIDRQDPELDKPEQEGDEERWT